MTQHLEPCPKCGREVPCATALDDGEDVRWAEWSCPCGLYYHAESRIVNERGVHDEEAELAELFGAWNTRAVRTCHLEQIPYAPGAHEGTRCSVCGVFDFVMGAGPYCSGCGAKIEEVAE